jgi:hypothetical protein
MEIGRETPDSATCTRVLEEALDTMAHGLRVVRQSLAPTVFIPTGPGRRVPVERATATPPR